MQLPEHHVGELRVRDRAPPEQALELVPSTRVCLLDLFRELLVNLAVHSADEEAGHAVHVTQIAAPDAKLLEAGEKSLDDLDVTLDAEDQGDVDVRALRDHRLDRGQPRGSGRDLDHHVRPCDAPLQVARRGDRELCVTGDFGRDLDADEPVSAVLTLVDRTQDIGGGLHVLDQQVPHGRLGLLPCVETPGHLVGVGVRALQRPGEDRRVRGDAADSGVAVPRQLPGADHSAVDLVEPHALAQALQFGDRIGLVHVVPPPSKTPAQPRLLPYSLRGRAKRHRRPPRLDAAGGHPRHAR